MKMEHRIGALEANISRYFEKHASRCLIRAVAGALVIAGVVAIVLWMVTTSRMISIASFGVLGLLSLNVLFLMLVPSIKSRKQSYALILSAAKDPSLILQMSSGTVAVKVEGGKPHKLTPIETKAWQAFVVPFLYKEYSMTLSSQKDVVEDGLSRSEMIRLKEQRKALKEDEARIREDRLELAKKRQNISKLQERLLNEEKDLQVAREEIQLRAESLEQAEELVISRLSEIEVAEAQMQQMREDLNSQQNSGQSSAADEARLKRKEAELDALRASLQEDKLVVEQQKTELNQLKGEIIREGVDETIPDFLSPEDSLRQRERELEAQFRKLKEAASDLEARTQYVQEVEDSLVDRLNSMSEREAFIEQGEVDAGLRADI
jgi:hypothetical protein